MITEKQNRIINVLENEGLEVDGKLKGIILLRTQKDIALR